MRCRPSIRILLTVKLSSVLCWACSTLEAAASASAATSARAFARRVRMIKDASTELTRDIVEQCHAHQQHQQCDAELLADSLEAIGQWTAFEPFNGLKYDLAAVKNRNRQQVHEAQRQADDHEKIQKRCQAEGGRIAGIFGDAERAAQVLHGNLPDQHAPEQPPLQGAHVPG